VKILNKYKLKQFAKFNISPFSKWYVKLTLILISLAFIVGSILYTNSLVDEIVLREKALLNFYTDIYEHYSDPNSNFEDISFFEEQIIPQINFPIIITDSNDVPLEPFDIYSLNVKTDTNLSYSLKRKVFVDMVSEMKSAYPPIVLVDNNNKILQKYYFYHSPLVDKFRSLPYLAFIVFLTVVAIGYVAFNASRRNEESKVWVGMAKEAAHQLGTPLSSLLAWLEILKMKSEDDYSQEIVKEMENDILRLNIVATRFSKIGSKADLTKTNIRELIEEISTYFEKRLPHLGRKIQIIREINQDYFCKLNTDLFSWVFENLFKNAAEAIEEKQGTIYITINKRGNSIRIYIRDTGKGMSKKVRRNIFSPGFTTKKRGWGLGLSLTKKIVEDYHKGKIWVKDSMPGKGSTFVIELPLEIN
jgi:two-component sensor histidine kinase